MISVHHLIGQDHDEIEQKDPASVGGAGKPKVKTGLFEKFRRDFRPSLELMIAFNGEFAIRRLMPPEQLDHPVDGIRASVRM